MHDPEQNRPAGRINLQGACLCFLAGLLLVSGSGCIGPRKNASPATPQVRSYLRVSTNANGAVGLDVAVRCLRLPNHRKRQIWLVAVTHMGTAGYFHEIQQLLNSSTVVLFEGVGARDPGFLKSRDDAGPLQRSLARTMGLEYQLDAIDYDRPGFKNSDLTLAEIQNLLVQHDRSGTEESTADSGHAEFGQLFSALQGTGLAGALARLSVGVIDASPRIQALVKLAFIELLGNLPSDFAAASNLSPGLKRVVTVLIEERNKKVVADVQAELQRRPAPRSVALLYGAGHMPDLERQLVSAIGCRFAEELWLRAFAVNPRAEGLSEFELRLTRSLVKRQLEQMAAPN